MRTASILRGWRCREVGERPRRTRIVHQSWTRVGANWQRVRAGGALTPSAAIDRDSSVTLSCLGSSHKRSRQRSCRSSGVDPGASQRIEVRSSARCLLAPRPLMASSGAASCLGELVQQRGATLQRADRGFACVPQPDARTSGSAPRNQPGSLFALRPDLNEASDALRRRCSFLRRDRSCPGT
jgi:hypothetical protein